MNLKEKCKNKGFWVSVVAAVVMVLQACGVQIDAPYVNEIVSAVMGVLVILGIVSDADRGGGYLDKTTDDISARDDEPNKTD